MKSFPDEVDITVRAGNGGPGSVSFLRARFQPRGRPDGGDGGAGGDIILEVSPNLRTLSHFRGRRVFAAENGRRGQSQDRHGKNGASLTIPVPLGTRVFDNDTGRFLKDLMTPGERFVLAKGGRGGKGNAHFTSSRMRSPRFSQPGEPGRERLIHLELQILADVGLMGAPNAGKTTLLKAMTASRARVGAFPFTTLTPQLGVMGPEADREPLILAEIPGLIVGAHLGKGLGHRFLRHLTRTRLLIQVIDLSQVDPADPLGPLNMLEEEMRAFDPSLLDKPRLVALNKIDLLAPDFPRDRVIRAYAEAGWRVFTVSAAIGEGLAPLREAIWAEFAVKPEPI
ncbi:MAG: GTPase ObgE [Syntrophobacterales bacterium]|nr:GTPase ObgE [Syntrophobacterales bacterium]